MNFLLAPAIFVMNRMRFGAKFAFILIGFVFTTGLLLGVLVTDRISAYRVEQRELRGAQVLPDFYALIMSLQQHRGMSAAALAGDDAMASKLPAKRAEVEAAFKALESVVAEAGIDTGLPGELATLKGEWSALVEGKFDAADSFARHTRLVTDARNLTSRAGDAFSLILDPTSVGYHLADLLINQIPELSETHARVRGTGAKVLADGVATPEELSQLQAILELAADRQSHITRVYEILRSQDPAVAARIEAQIGKVASAQRAVADSVAAMRTGAVPAAQNFFVLATEPVVDSFDLSKVGTDALNALLEARLRHDLNVTAVTVIFGVGSIFMALYMMLGLRVSLRNAVDALMRGADAMANGDLRVRVEVPSHDELRDIAGRFNAMAESMGTLVGQIQGGMQALDSACSNLATVSTRVSGGSRQQADAAQAVAGAVEEMTVSIASVADSVNDSLAVSERARELSADGETVVRDAATEIGYMASAVRDSGALVERLSEHSSRVSGIVRVIRDVADQTNLLALNAAIEAARAGELGRGFAVVADEVRKLAERTALATTEIAEVIRNIEEATGDSVRGIKAAAAHVDSGVERASRAAEALVEIRSGTSVTLEHIAGIAGAAREQRSASQEIANNVEAIAHMATENDAAVHDIDVIARDLSAEASKLGTLVQRFRVA